MASVFQRDGRWIAKYKDERGQWATRSCGSADKATAKRWAAAWENEARDMREGRVDPRADKYREGEARPLADHVADFKAMLTGKGNTPAHVAETAAHVERIIGLANAQRATDLTADVVRRAIAGIRESGRSLRTCNAILRSVKTFMGWLAADNRIRHNDVRLIKAYNADTDRRRVRRDLSNDELGRIIDAARIGPVSFGMSGGARAMAYATAAGTGFRASELASLTPASFRLDDDPPAIAVNAAYSKRRRDDQQPIDGALADTLAKWLADKPAGERVFPLPHKTAEMLRGDMRRARAKWLRDAADPMERRERHKSDFLEVVDHAGRVFDFHGFRHLYVSRVVSGGASVKVAQELARHSSPVLTIGRYSHVRLADLRRAVPSVPTGDKTGPEAVTLRATGTENSAPLAHQTGRESVRERATGCGAGRTMRIAANSAQVFPDAEISKAPQFPAEPCDKRGRRGSNPQPPDRQSERQVVRAEYDRSYGRF